MNFKNVDPATAELIALPWLLEKLEPASEYGRTAMKMLRPFALGEETQALAHIERVVRVAQTLNAHEISASRASLRDAGDATAAIARLSVSEVLTDSHFLQIRQFCEIVNEVAARTMSADVPRLPSCDQVLSILAPGCASNIGFYLDDAFTPELAEKRMQFEKAQVDFDVARGYVAQRVARAINREEVGHGQFVLMRDAVQGALPAELHVVREAPTYYLC
ncbi:MAG: hypothetical protein M3160_10765, partial [Candidatus Eremiobacteraeota bacterium]|nr:hypothetical protein [Candidatus Eremiobacteraeota bacterium]